MCTITQEEARLLDQAAEHVKFNLVEAWMKLETCKAYSSIYNDYIARKGCSQMTWADAMSHRHECLEKNAEAVINLLACAQQMAYRIYLQDDPDEQAAFQRARDKFPFEALFRMQIPRLSWAC